MNEENPGLRPGYGVFLVNFFVYPVVIDGRLFRETFGWKPRRSLNDIFGYYLQTEIGRTVIASTPKRSPDEVRGARL